VSQAAQETIRMGYSTDFEGQFHCYRPESKELGAFLKAIREGDTTALGPLADWLMDHEDPRGEEIARLCKSAEPSLKTFWPLFGLKPNHMAYLNLFSDTRRMKRDAKKAKELPDPVREAVGLPLGPEAAYFTGGNGFKGQDEDSSILDYNRPPHGQPGLWCQWVPSEDGTAILWNGMEKFYNYTKWLEYLVKHFLQPWGYVLNGEVTWSGEEPEDTGVIRIRENILKVEGNPGA
jgi:hypothetical protein